MSDEKKEMIDKYNILDKQLNNINIDLSLNAENNMEEILLSKNKWLEKKVEEIKKEMNAVKSRI